MSKCLSATGAKELFGSQPRHGSHDKYLGLEGGLGNQELTLTLSLSLFLKFGTAEAGRRKQEAKHVFSFFVG